MALILQESAFLEHLDVSWNDLIPIHFTPLLEVVQGNRTLISLNLSWNTIIDATDQNNDFGFTYNSALDDYINQRRMAIEQNKDQIEEEKLSHPEFVASTLSKFIRYNKRLQTVNLSNTGLNG